MLSSYSILTVLSTIECKYVILYASLVTHVVVSENYSIKVESWTWSWNRDGVKFDLRSCLWEIRCWLIFVNFMKCHNFLKFHKILQILIFFCFLKDWETTVLSPSYIYFLRLVSRDKDLLQIRMKYTIMITRPQDH